MFKPRQLIERTPITLLIGIWGICVLVGYVHRFAPMLGSTVDALRTIGLGALSLYVVCFTGHRVLCRCCGFWSTRRSGLEIMVLESAVGSGVVIIVMLMLGVAGAYSSTVAYSALAVGLCGNHARFWRSLRHRWASWRPTESPILTSLLFVIGGLTLIQSLAPATSQDALVYHLLVPQRYIAEGGIHFIPGNLYAHFPQNIEMLFTLGMLLDGAELAKLYHWLFGVGCCLSCATLAQSLHPRSSGVLAAAVFATIPTAALISSWAYIDLAIVFYTLLSVHCFVRYCRHEQARWLIFASILAGLAAGCKYTGGLQGLLMVAGVLLLGWVRRTERLRVSRDVVTICGLVALVAGPWWIKNLIYTGNPLYPFLYGVFGGDGWDPERSYLFSESLRQWGGDRGFWSTLLLPWNLTMESDFFVVERFDGVIGCGFLIGLPVVLWALRSSKQHRVLFVLLIAHFVGWAILTRQIRFLLPTCAIFAALLAASVPLLDHSSLGRRCVHAILILALAVNVLMASLNFASHEPLGVVLGLESDDTYLRRELPGDDCEVFEYIRESLPHDCYILFAASGNPGYLCERPFYSDAFLENYTLKRVLDSANNPRQVLRALRDRGFTHLLFRFELVFDPSGRKSDIPLEDQKKFAEFLNEYTTVLIQKSGTFLSVIAPKRATDEHRARLELRAESR